MNVDGSEPQRTYQGSPADSPTWVPTGDRIAFTCGGGEICVMRSDGTDLESLVTLDFQGKVDDLDWSPDGSTIVFACGTGLCTVQSDGTNLVELPGEILDADPAWSPDGSRIAFTGFRGGIFNFKQGLQVMDADGANPRTLYSGGTGLFSGGGGVSDPVWSPDGSQIAATCVPPGEVAFALCFIDVNGGGLSTVSQGDEGWWGYDWAVVGGAAPAPPALSASHSLTLRPGGNLVGWTGATPVAEATASISGQYDAIFTFDAATQAFQVFRPAGLPLLNSLENLALGDGAWVNVTNPNGAVWQVPVVDSPRDVPLGAQFNLVVWTGPDETSVADAVAGILGTLEALFTWDAVADEFLSFRPGAPPFLNTAGVLRYGDGMWLNMTAPTVWSQSASGLSTASR